VQILTDKHHAGNKGTGRDAPPRLTPTTIADR